jgi:hypothetical protein
MPIPRAFLRSGRPFLRGDVSGCEFSANTQYKSDTSGLWINLPKRLCGGAQMG